MCDTTIIFLILLVLGCVSYALLVRHEARQRREWLKAEAERVKPVRTAPPKIDPHSVVVPLTEAEALVLAGISISQGKSFQAVMRDALLAYQQTLNRPTGHNPKEPT